MFNKLYGFLVGQKLSRLDLFLYLRTAEDYGKIYKVMNDITGPFNEHGKLTENCDDEPIFISEQDREGVYIVFYQNLYFLFYSNDEDRDMIVQIYIKRPEDTWHLPVNNDGSLDYLNPANVKVGIYTNYSVSVTKLGRTLGHCGGEDYRSGTWDKMVYKSLISFLEKVENYTEINQIKQAYKC